MLGLIVIVFLILNLHACGWHHHCCPLLCACISLAGNIDTNSPYMLNYWAGPSKIEFRWWLAPLSPEAMFNRPSLGGTSNDTRLNSWTIFAMLLPMILKLCSAFLNQMRPKSPYPFLNLRTKQAQKLAHSSTERPKKLQSG